MSLAAVTAKLSGVTLHLGCADTGGLYCGRRETDKTLFTWRPEEATCKKCLKKYADFKVSELKVEYDVGRRGRMIYYDLERAERLFDQPRFNCATCGKEVRESEWASLCQDCGEAEEESEREHG